MPGTIQISPTRFRQRVTVPKAGIEDPLDTPCRKNDCRISNLDSTPSHLEQKVVVEHFVTV